jgi:Icc-related predicted phosphoesterase
MLLVSDVHGAWEALRRVAASGGPLLILGDLVNFVDYRTYEGILSEIYGRDLVGAVSRMRAAGDFDEARAAWRTAAAGREEEIRSRFTELILASYREMAEALGDCEAYVTYGNVDDPVMLAEMLPPRSRFVDGEVVELDGARFGFAGGGIGPDFGAPGIVSEEDMAAKLARLGPVDVLCTHAAPAVSQLSNDVIGGDAKQSQAILEYLREQQPAWHYFGDVLQPKALGWRVGRTWCQNLGYFRATGRPVRHG